MLARKFSSDGVRRWPRPCRARNATSLPSSRPTTYGSEGSPNGVVSANLFLRLKSWHGIQATAAYDTDFRFDGQSRTGSF